MEFVDVKGNNDLHNAKDGNTASELIRAGFDVDFRNKTGCTALHLACQHGRDDIVDVLLDNHATVDARAKNNKTPLHLAAQYGHSTTVERLIEAGADVTALDSAGMTPAHLACRYNHAEVVDLLTEESDAAASASYLHTAAKHGALNAIQTLLKKGADVSTTDGNGWTPLHVACQQGNLWVVTALLNADPSLVNARDAGNWTPLHLAARYNKYSVVELLVEHGAQVDALTNNNATPSNLAQKFNYSPIVEYLAAAAN